MLLCICNFIEIVQCVAYGLNFLCFLLKSTNYCLGNCEVPIFLWSLECIDVTCEDVVSFA